MRRYFWDWINDDLGLFGDFSSTWPAQRRVWVDPDKYTITPNKEYQKVLIEKKQKEIESLDEQRKRLEEELKQLKG